MLIHYQGHSIQVSVPKKLRNQTCGVFQIQAQGKSKYSFVSIQHEFLRDVPKYPVSKFPGIRIHRMLYDPFDLMIAIEWSYSGLPFRIQEFQIGALLNMAVFYEDRMLEDASISTN